MNNSNIIFTKKAEEHLIFFRNNDKKTLSKINALIEAILKNPYEGIGKPEELKHEYKGCYSRRINKRDRLIYKIENNNLIILSCKFHYKDK